VLAFVSALALGVLSNADRAPGDAAPLPVMRFNVPLPTAVPPTAPRHVHLQPGINPRERLHAPTINPYL
jgi:hypothetical protein